MKKINSKSPITAFFGPDVSSMYCLFYQSLKMWDQQKQLIDQGKEAKLYAACKYSIVFQAYTILDAVIHSYVATNGFQTSKQENKLSVYSKWKNFPRIVESHSFKKEDISIIEEIRELRNQIAHPKVRVETISESIEGDVSLDISEPNTNNVIGFLNLSPRPQFTLEHGMFLADEVTRLLILAENTLNKAHFIPKKKHAIFGETKCWPKNVTAI